MNFISENKKNSGTPAGGDWNFSRGRGRGRGEFGTGRAGTDLPGSPPRATLILIVQKFNVKYFSSDYRKAFNDFLFGRCENTNTIRLSE